MYQIKLTFWISEINQHTHFPFFFAGACPFASASALAFLAAIFAASRAASLQFIVS